MALGHLLMIFIAVLISNTASVGKAENAITVQTGRSVQLEIQTNKQAKSLVWMNEKSENIVTFIRKTGETVVSSNKYNVVFNQSTFSLTLKNMQKTDSGLYTARTFGTDHIDVAKYRVSVIDPVDSPVLYWNITMFSVNTCIVNISCSGHDHTISDSYHSNNCSQKEITSFGMQTVSLYCKEDIVICNYSNPVSWKNDTIHIKQLCEVTHYPNDSPGENNNSIPLHWLITIVISTSLFILVAAAVIYCSHKNRNKGAQQNEHTIYSQVQPKSKIQRPLEMLEKSANPGTVYGFTEEHRRHTYNTNQTMSSSEISAEMQTNNRPSTTYSTIGQHQKPSFATERDHTIYSTVCKSSNGRRPVH